MHETPLLNFIIYLYLIFDFQYDSYWNSSSSDGCY